MIIGSRLRDLREAKQLSQGDIEKRTGLLRCYISRVENGHTVPSIETLEKITRALEVPMYELFYDGVEPPKVPSSINMLSQRQKIDWALRGKGLRAFTTIAKTMGQMSERDRKLLLHLARKMSHRQRGGRES
ncbi:MAG: helix-turn-helix transcriptional regulator [Acidobacteria bacterium]|nr:helix-turn-helix transcriptional regulator [Acidobacteriota bacterium]